MKLYLPAAALVIGSVFVSPARSQTAGQMYPTNLNGYLVKNTWMDASPQTISGQTKSTIGVHFVTNPLIHFCYPYDPNNQAQVSQANSVYASFLSAMATGTPVRIKPYTFDSARNIWYFDVVQVGDD